MARLGRPGISDERKQELWDRWAAGESISEISRAMGKPPGSVYTILRSRGGCVPRRRRVRANALTLAEREEISRGLASGEAIRSIARRLGRAPSPARREVARNKGPRRYRAVDAEDRAFYRAKRPQRCLLAKRPGLAAFVRGRLEEDWSPEQVSGHLAVAFAGNSEMQVSHETIYKTLFIQSRGC